VKASSPEPHIHDHAMPHAADVAGKGHERHGTIGHAGHGERGVRDRHAGHSVAMFRDKFWITLLLSIPTLLWSGMVQDMFGFSAPIFPGSAFVPALFGTAVYFYGGLVFVKGGLEELRDRKPGMMTLISLAITVAFVFSLAVTLGYPGEALWWELASLVTIMLLGHWIEMRSIPQASGALRELARLLPSTAQRIVGETIEDVEISALREGDLVLVRPGASVPADGVVESGKSDVNESMITGESVPVAKTEGAKVIAGTVNGSGSLRVRVTGTGERTALANIMRLVEQAQTSRSRAQALADRRVPAHDRRGGGWRSDPCRLACARSDRSVRGRTAGLRARHRVPACARACRAAGGGYLHQSGRTVGTARPRSTRSRGGARPHHRGVRQDWHPDAR
jgi:P-type Cu2+ transporter